MSKKQTVPNTAPKPTETPKAQLADKNKAMTTGSVVQKDGFSPLVGNNIDHVIGHTPIKK